MRSQEIGGVSADDVVKVGGALGVLWGLVRFIVGPRIRESLKDALKPDLAELHEAAVKARKAAETSERTAIVLETLVLRLKQMEEDFDVIEAVVHDNRDCLRDLVAFLDVALNIDRRESERRSLPEVPRLPERRRRDRREE